MFKFRKFIFLFVCVLTMLGFVIPQTSFAVPIVFYSDPNEDWPSTNGSVDSIVTDSDGYVYIAGNFTRVGGVSRNHIAKLNSDGTLNSWDPDVSQEIEVVALSPDENTIYIGSRFVFNANQSTTPVARNRIAAFSTSTGVVTSWDPDINNTVSSIVVSSDGATVYAGGNFTSVNQGTTPLTRNRIAAFSATTGVATSFNPDVNLSVRSLVLKSDDSVLYASGNFTSVNQGTTPLTRNRIAGFNTTTSVATSFNPNLDASVGQIILSDNDSVLYAGGDFNSVNQSTTPLTRNYLAAFNTATSVGTSFDPDLDSFVTGISFGNEEAQIYAVGEFTQVNQGGTPLTRNYGAAFNATTGLDLGWDPDFDDVGSAILVPSDLSAVYAGGVFNTQSGGSFSQENFARFDPEDNTAPIITEVTPVDTPTNDNTPSYTLNIDEESEISFSGDCTADNFEDTWPAGDIAINFDAFSDGTYDDCEITATDAHGNESDPLIVSEFTIDTTDPNISSIVATASATSATITWTTDENSSSSVSYGTTISYGTDTAESDTSPRVTSHSVLISGLNSCTTYHYTVNSTDTATNEATSSDQTFTTTGCSSGGGVVLISFIPQQPITQTLPQNLEVVKFIFTKNLKSNLKDEEVRQLQKYLNNHKFPVSNFGSGSLGYETNFFGVKTKNAVMKLQKEIKLKPDGIVGPLTRAYINSHP
jgi:hypothetical protein